MLAGASTRDDCQRGAESERLHRANDRIQPKEAERTSRPRRMGEILETEMEILKNLNRDQRIRADCRGFRYEVLVDGRWLASDMMFDIRVYHRACQERQRSFPSAPRALSAHELIETLTPSTAVARKRSAGTGGLDEAAEGNREPSGG